MMDFRPESVIKTVNMGKRDGKNAIEKGEGVEFKEFIEWANSMEKS